MELHAFQFVFGEDTHLLLALLDVLLNESPRPGVHLRLGLVERAQGATHFAVFSFCARQQHVPMVELPAGSKHPQQLQLDQGAEVRARRRGCKCRPSGRLGA
jgi:hypothetical protein